MSYNPDETNYEDDAEYDDVDDGLNFDVDEEDDGRDPGHDGNDDDDDRSMFAEPGGNSALRAATRSNPRNLPCPTCKEPNRLTPADRARGYQCNVCADRAEQGW